MQRSEPIVAHSRTAIRKGSKSFSFASRLLAKDEREAAMMLYSWCRYCDDRTDIKDRATSYEIKQHNLDDLIAKTAAVYRGEMPDEPEFGAMAHVVRKYNLPAYYPQELLAGMAMDLNHDGFETVADLMRYCYRVAGVVGLMMVHVLRVSQTAALKHAQDMGMAMQLTNIARDIVEDAEMGRIYLPREWMREVGLDEKDILAPVSRAKLAQLSQKLVVMAEALYRSGDEGIKYLPFYAAFSVVAARQVYSAIGQRVVRRGPEAWNSRTWIPRWKKFLMLGPIVLSVLKSIPERMKAPWRAESITGVRRFEWPQ